MKQWWAVLLVPAFLAPAAIVVALLVGGGQQEESAPGTRPEFPDFVYHSPKAERAYQLAVENRQLLAVMPCYCGCALMPEDPHGSLLDCFVNEDGSFDSHASGCEICADIAVDAVQWRSEGKSLAQVRSLVDAEYQDYGVPTSTDPIVE